MTMCDVWCSDSSVCERVRIDWHSSLHQLCDNLVSHLSTQLHSACHAALQQSEEYLSQHSAMPYVAVPPQILCNMPDCSPHVLQSAFIIQQEFDRLLPLAKVGSESLLLALRAAYIAALEQVLDNCASLFDKVTEMSSQQLPMSCRYLVMSSASFLCDMTQTLVDLLAVVGADKNGLDERIAELEKVQHRARSAVELHHCTHLMTSVLCDADCHNWADDGDHFEVRTVTVELFQCIHIEH